MKDLNSLGAKWSELTAELRSANEALTALDSEISGLVAALHAADAPALLGAFAGSENAALDSAIQEQLDRLGRARARREILPGVITRFERRRAEVTAEIATAVDRVFMGIKRQAREQVEAIKSAEMADLEKTYGGDIYRARAAASAKAENCEANRWYQLIRSMDRQLGSPAAAAARAPLIEAGFRAGKSLSQAVKDSESAVRNMAVGSAK